MEECSVYGDEKAMPPSPTLANRPDVQTNGPNPASSSHDSASPMGSDTEKEPQDFHRLTSSRSKQKLLKRRHQSKNEITMYTMYQCMYKNI